MKKGSHNTMTYLKPSKWYLYPFIFVAKCQSIDYKKQFNCGVRWFDLRLKTTTNLNDEPIIAHGLMSYKTYKGFVDEFLQYLNEKAQEDLKNPIYVRLLYELSAKDKSTHSVIKENNFIELCKLYQQKYPFVHFIGGNRKYDWKILVNLETQPCQLDLYSSMTWKKWDDWCPWLYAHFMNKKNWDKYKDIKPDCFALMDFIN